MNLKDSKLSKEQQARVHDLKEEHKVAFSLEDEIQTYPQVEVHIKLYDKTSFFVCPYAVKEKH